MTIVESTVQTTDLAAGTWAADPVHSDITVKVRHMGVGRVKGSFALAGGTLTVPVEGLTAASVAVVIDAASVDTRNEQRNGHIRSADFLDVENYPTIEFTSTEIRNFDGETFTLVGDLTVHGVTRQVELAAEFSGAMPDAQGNDRSGFAAVTAISRREFGVDIELPFGAGNAVVADKIEIGIDVEFTRTEG